MRSTVTSVRPHPLHTTSNSRFDFSGKSSPFRADTLDVPVDLLPHLCEAPEYRAWRDEALRREQVAVRLRGEWSGRDPRCEQPELREALPAVRIVVVRPPQRFRQRLDEPQAASELGWLGGAKPVHENSELKTADREAAKSVPLFSQAVRDEVVVREGENVGWEAAQATPPT